MFRSTLPCRDGASEVEGNGFVKFPEGAGAGAGAGAGNADGTVAKGGAEGTVEADNAGLPIIFREYWAAHSVIPALVASGAVCVACLALKPLK